MMPEAQYRDTARRIINTTSKDWGRAWPRLSEEHRKALLAVELLQVVLGFSRTTPLEVVHKWIKGVTAYWEEEGTSL